MDQDQQEQQSEQENSQTSSGNKGPLKVVEIGVVLVLIVLAVLYYFYYAENKRLASLTVESIASSADNHDFEKALGVTAAVLKNDPANISAMLAEAIIWNQRGFIEINTEYNIKATEIANNVLLIDGKNAEAWRIIGYSNEVQGKYSNAIEAYLMSLSLDPSNPLTYNNLGHTYDLVGDLARAKLNYLKANSINPLIDMVHLNLGRTLYRENDFDGALAEFDITIELTDDIRLMAEAYYSSGVVYTTKKEYDTAEELFRKAIEADSKYSSGFVGLARSLFFEISIIKDGEQIVANITEALDNLNIAKEVEPGKTMVYFTEGLIYNTVGEHLLAIDALNKAVEVIDDDHTINAIDRETLRNAIFTELAKL